jgi:hypothetical protein
LTSFIRQKRSTLPEKKKEVSNLVEAAAQLELQVLKVQATQKNTKISFHCLPDTEGTNSGSALKLGGRFSKSIYGGHIAKLFSAQL